MGKLAHQCEEGIMSRKPKKPSAPKISLRARQKAVEGKISRGKARRAALLSGGLASRHDIDRIDQQLDEWRRELAELTGVRRAKVRAARGRATAGERVERLAVDIANVQSRLAGLRRSAWRCAHHGGPVAHVADWLAAAVPAAEAELAALRVRQGKAAERTRGATRDRFAQFVGRSKRLTAWHLSVADALRDAEARALGAGQTGAGVSGRAGDGDGRLVVVVGEDGELDPALLGALAVAGVSARGALARWHKAARTRAADGRRIDPPRTFDPKGVKAVRKVSDGGMAAICDARREGERLWEMFFEGAAGAVGGHPGFAQLAAFGAEQVIRGRMSVGEVVRELLKTKIQRGYETLETAMVAGLEAVGGRLGFDDRAKRALDTGNF